MGRHCLHCRFGVVLLVNDSGWWHPLLVHPFFWLVAAISISFQRAPLMTLVVIVAAVAMWYAGYFTGWSDCERAKLYEDKT